MAEYLAIEARNVAPLPDDVDFNIGNISTLDEAVAVFNSTERHAGKTVIRSRVSECALAADCRG